MACTALVPLLAPDMARAGPETPTVVAGQVTVSGAGPVLTVTQGTDRAIVNWQSFSIAPGETTRFVQPSATAAILNRVTGADPSAIMGQLSANGRVYLINPNGVVIGPQGRVEAGGFVASTLDASNSDFLSGGPLRFAGASTAGVKVLGALKVEGGDAVLVARRVENAGRIEAADGQAVLAAGGSVLYVPGGGDIVIETPAEGALVDNSGAITAAAAQLRAAGGAYALAVRSTGEVSATSVRNVGGRIVLDAGEGEASLDGTLRARDGDKGGQVVVAGRTIGLTETALIDASGPLGGGRVAVGGGAHGADATIRNAERVTVAAGARLEASATTRGDGGTLVVWSDRETDFRGAIKGRGGVEGGNGGWAEVSGKTLTYRGRTDMSAPLGRAGKLLLDPADLTIDGTFATSIVNDLLGADFEIVVDNELTVASDIISAAPQSLRLVAPTIRINADITVGGTLSFDGNAGAGLPPNALTSASGADLNASTIFLQSLFETVDLQGRVTTPSLQLNGGSGGYFSIANANNDIDDAFVINDQNFSGNFRLATTGNLQLWGDFLNANGNIDVVADGDLSVNLPLMATQVTLVAGDAFKNLKGTTLFSAGYGRAVIYSDPTGFDAGGLTFPNYVNVNYPSDPFTGDAIYLAGSTPRPVLTVTANDASRMYGQANPAFSARYSGGSVSDLYAPVQFRILGPGVNVGTYGIQPYGASSITHDLSYVDGVLTVTPAPLTMTALNATRAYGEANPGFGFSYAGFVNGDTSAVVSGLTLNTTATVRSKVGDYAIVGSGAQAANYTIRYVDGVLSITPAVLVITANDATRLYGASNPGFSASYSGLVNGETASVVSGLSFSTTASKMSGVGDYAIVGSGARAANYTILYANGRLNVTPAPLVITIDNVTRVYGASNPTFTASYSGLLNNDTSAVVSGLALFTEATAGSDVGDYVILGANARAANYAIRYVDGRLRVTRAPLVITASSVSRLYGDQNPTLTATYSGLVNGDNASVVSGLTFATSAAAGSDVGTYAITLGGGSATNYAITRVNGIMTVTPAPLTIRANNAQITQNATLPTFGASIEGLRNSDTADLVSLTYATNAGGTGKPGTYSITPGGRLTRGNNYTLRFVDGVLTVVEAPPIVTIQPPPSDTSGELIVDIGGDKTDADKALEEFGKDLDAAKANQQVVICGVSCQIFKGAARDEFNDVLDDVASLFSGGGAKMTAADIKLALADPASSIATMSSLMPYLYARLEEILTRPEPWSTSEAAYVESIRAYIEAQRKANADYALAEYQKWALAQYEIKRAVMDTVDEGGIGNTAAGVIQAGIHGNEPPIPPQALLDQFKVGLVLDNGSFATYAGLAIDLGRQVEMEDGSTAGGAASKASSATLAVAEALLKGPGFAPGKAMQTVKEMGGIAEKIVDVITPFARGAKRKLLVQANLAGSGVKAVSETTDVTTDVAKVAGKNVDEVLDGAQAAGKLAKTVKSVKAIPVLGLVLGILADAVGVGITTVTYVQIGDFNKDFDNAYAQAQAPVTIDQLRAMTKDQSGQLGLFNYMMTMAATNGQPPDVPKPTMTRVQVTRTAMLTY